MQGEIEMKIGKLKNLEKLKFPFWVEGSLVMIFDGARRVVIAGGSGSRDGEDRRGKWQGARWGQDWWGQEGQMAGRKGMVGGRSARAFARCGGSRRVAGTAVPDEGAARGQIREKTQLETRWGWDKMVGVGTLRWNTRQGIRF